MWRVEFVETGSDNSDLSLTKIDVSRLVHFDDLIVGSALEAEVSPAEKLNIRARLSCQKCVTFLSNPAEEPVTDGVSRRSLIALRKCRYTLSYLRALGGLRAYSLF